MKKFFTYISMLPADAIFQCDYTSNSPRLRASGIRFPVSAMIEGYTEPGEEIAVIGVMEKDNENCKRNYVLFTEELDSLSARLGITYHLEIIEISGEETSEAHLKTFSMLIRRIDDGDIVHSCMTYGTKPTPIVEMMAMNFAYKAKQNVTIRCIAYGRLKLLDGKPVGAILYDITPLFYMNELSDQLGRAHVKNPEDFIEKLLEGGIGK